ncbi:hypothetical protein IX308_000992 [Porphyromonas levii]|nr:hypothetical protein [Porphyromonas levii]MBR8784804.1 hypothetical protein [Porphyromonas levii]
MASPHFASQQTKITIMSQMIVRGKEMLRISPKDSKKLEFSTNDGRTWNTRFSGATNVGEFIDLTDVGKEVLAQTTKGLFFSKNDGRTWNKRS